MIANAEARCKAIGKSASWVIPAALSSNKSKLWHEICVHGRRHISWFSAKPLLVPRNDSTNTMNEHLKKQSDIICKKNSRTELGNIKATVGNDNLNDNISTNFLLSKEDESRFFTPICANLEDENLQTKKITNNIFRQSSTLNVADHGCEADAQNCNNKTTRDDILNIVERKDWIQRVYSNIKSTFRDLHVTIQSWSATTLDSYSLGNIFALNESIPAADAMSYNTVFFARKDSKSKIRKKIEEFCTQRKNRKKPSRDDICNKRKRSCKAAKKDICQKREKCQKKEKLCQKKEKPCQEKEKPCQERKKPDCSKRKKWVLTKQKRVVCEQKKSDKDKVCDCRTTRKVEPQEKPCIRRKDDDTYSCEDQPCTKPKDCKSILDSCETFCKEKKKKDSEKHDRTEIKKVAPCKKQCPTVVKAPGCPEDDEKKRGSRKYSTYVS
ncbi:hypothetical protein X777_10467 [Ooceraea biroi]|uniref:Uncharacterized protein n=1 Tax=Ooceraea biroi TaxID=2015173 RepID=A0A026W731_OOCBI|nr:hypothetical protein X777_10467 [Ooceraea biroi]